MRYEHLRHRRVALHNRFALAVVFFIVVACSGEKEGDDVVRVGPGPVALQWDAPTTNEDGTLLIHLAGYRVYGDGDILAETRETRVELDLLEEVYVTVRAFDVNGNESEDSEGLMVLE